MKKRVLTEDAINQFHDYLLQEEKSPATLEKYIRDVRRFCAFANDQQITKELVIAYKKDLVEKEYAVCSINSMLASINSFFDFFGWSSCKAKCIKTQRKIYCKEEKELTKAEYLRLLDAAKRDTRLTLVLKTICSTGIRVSELRYFTVEALDQGEVIVDCKNKTRSILLPGKLKKQLKDYVKKQKIFSGPIFITRSGKPLNRSNIWSQMKKLCQEAGVQASKVFPHNLRKLFAKTFYSVGKDIAKLADVLGHSSIDTTRIYIMTTGIEHRKIMDSLRLVI